MIKYILVQNRQGKTRIFKWFISASETEKNEIKQNVHRLVSSRDQRMSNVVLFSNDKIVYRRYAGLYFCFGLDKSDNELGYMEFIHFFVETLDSMFKNVCELDLVYNVYAIIDEMFLGGEIQETSKTIIQQRIQNLA